MSPRGVASLRTIIRFVITIHRLRKPSCILLYLTYRSFFAETQIEEAKTAEIELAEKLMRTERRRAK